MFWLFDKLGELWCQTFHSDIMWPVRGKYRCRKCFREYPVAWEQDLRQPQPVPVRSEPVLDGRYFNSWMRMLRQRTS
jgi:hypothetical protein